MIIYQDQLLVALQLSNLINLMLNQNITTQLLIEKRSRWLKETQSLNHDQCKGVSLRIIKTIQSLRTLQISIICMAIV